MEISKETESSRKTIVSLIFLFHTVNTKKTVNFDELLF